MFPLYQLANDYQQAMDELSAIDDLSEEILRDTLDGLAGDLEQKSLQIAAYIKNIEAEASAIKEIEESRKDKRQRLERRLAKLKDYLKFNLERCNIKKISSPELDIAIQKNPYSLVIEDANLIPAEFIHVKEEVVIDRVLIKQALKDGAHVPGIRLESSNRLSIK
jgi:predicted nuclease with TOPRIM domain